MASSDRAPPALAGRIRSATANLGGSGVEAGFRRFGGGLALVARALLGGRGRRGREEFCKIHLKCSPRLGCVLLGYGAQRCFFLLSGRLRSRGSPVRLLLSRLASRPASKEHAPLASELAACNTLVGTELVRMRRAQAVRLPDLDNCPCTIAGKRPSASGSVSAVDRHRLCGPGVSRLPTTRRVRSERQARDGASHLRRHGRRAGLSDRPRTYGAYAARTSRPGPQSCRGGCPRPGYDERVWRVRYEDDGKVWATPERFLRR